MRHRLVKVQCSSEKKGDFYYIYLVPACLARLVLDVLLSDLLILRLPKPQLSIVYCRGGLTAYTSSDTGISCKEMGELLSIMGL